MTLITPT